MTDIDVVLPAGGRLPADFAAEAGAEVKALIEIDGQTLLERALLAVRGCSLAGRVVVVGPAEVQEHPAAELADVVLPDAGSGPANNLLALDWLLQTAASSDPSRALLVTTDLPFLASEHLLDLVARSPAEWELSAPILDRAEMERRFPDYPLEYLKLGDGEWTMGSAFVVRPDALLRNRAGLERAFAARKGKLAMVRLLGLKVVLGYLTGRLALAQVEARCRDLLGCTGGAIRGAAPELVFDVDLPEEYRYALAHGRRLGTAP